jgi:hypothetical protein
MTFHEAYLIIEKIKYKPGWSFSISRKDAKVSMSVVHSAQDVSGKVEGLIPLRLMDTFPEQHLNSFTEGELINEVRKLIAQMEKHEIDEWLRVDGRRLIDPHQGEV